MAADHTGAGKSELGNACLKTNNLFKVDDSPDNMTFQDLMLVHKN
jgi:hypothetical protein